MGQELLLLPVFLASGTAFSRTGVLTSVPQMSSQRSSEPKRKQGICSSVSPVLASQRSSTSDCQVDLKLRHSIPPPPPPLPLTIKEDSRYQSMRSQQSCEFITFKGLPGANYLKELNQDQEMSGIQGDKNTNLKSSPVNGIKMVERGEFRIVGVDSDPKLARLTLDGNSFHATGVKPYNRELPQDEESSNESKLPFRFAGIIGALLSSLFFSLSVLFVKLLPNESSIQETAKVCLFRGIFLILICGSTIIVQGSNILVERNEILINVLRVSIGSLGALGGYAALQYITVAESTSIIYSSPVWTSILSYFILREPLPKTLLLAIPLGFYGITMIARPDFILGEEAVDNEVHTEVQRHHHSFLVNNTISVAANNLTMSYGTHHESAQEWSAILDTITTDDGRVNEMTPQAETEVYLMQRWPGMLISFGTSITTSIVFILFKLCKTTPILTVSFYVGFGNAIMAIVVQSFVGYGKMPSTIEEWLLLCGMGVTSWLGQAMTQWSCHHEKASLVSTIRLTDVVLAFLWSAIFLDEDILWTSIVGAIVIMFIVGLLIANDHIERLCCSMCKN